MVAGSSAGTGSATAPARTGKPAGSSTLDALGDPLAGMVDPLLEGSAVPSTVEGEGLQAVVTAAATSSQPATAGRNG
jgi:hypothetical protein